MAFFGRKPAGTNGAVPSDLSALRPAQSPGKFRHQKLAPGPIADAPAIGISFKMPSSNSTR